MTWARPARPGRSDEAAPGILRLAVDHKGRRRVSPQAKVRRLPLQLVALAALPAIAMAADRVPLKHGRYLQIAKPTSMTFDGKPPMLPPQDQTAN